MDDGDYVLTCHPWDSYASYSYYDSYSSYSYYDSYSYDSYSSYSSYSYYDSMSYYASDSYYSYSYYDSMSYYTSDSYDSYSYYDSMSYYDSYSSDSYYDSYDSMSYYDYYGSSSYYEDYSCDDEGFADSAGDGCDWYESYPESCESFMNSLGDVAADCCSVCVVEEECSICGDYLMTNSIGCNAPYAQYANDWHYVTISEDDDGELTWTNAAGVSWGLDYDEEAGVITTHSECPYGVFDMQVFDDGVIENVSGVGGHQEPFTPAEDVVYC